MDVERLFDNISQSARLSQKSEFESTTAYQNRLIAFRSASILPGLAAQDTIAIVLGSSDKDDVASSLGTTYDADLGAFDLKLSFRTRRNHLLVASPEWAEIDVRSHQLRGSDYVAGNAMGATVAVHQYSSDSYGIAVEPNAWLFPPTTTSHNSTDGISFRLSIPSAVAAVVKPQIRVAVVGRLRSPWTTKNMMSVEATFDNPSGMVDSEHYLILDPSEVIVFREDTGEVLKRLDAAGAHAFLLNLNSSCRSLVVVSVVADGKSDAMACENQLMIRANHSIEIHTAREWAMGEMSFQLNGDQYAPAWSKEERTTMITAPSRSSVYQAREHPKAHREIYRAPHASWRSVPTTLEITSPLENL